ncbi:MAG: hypothetical protein LBR10_10885 [Prevotellaceae bacterium]|nr:hypothetical protein [Prevotellaceae bacterium]
MRCFASGCAVAMTATPNEKVAKQPKGLDFHNRRSSTCGKVPVCSLPERQD